MRKVTFEIPAEYGDVLDRAWPNLAQAAKESLAIESYRVGRISAGELAGLLELETSIEALEWLGARGIPMNYGIEQFEEDLRTLERLEALGKLPPAPGTKDAA
ncbi:MAG: UPF0175 family protein [Phycisphaerales bacterium]